MVHSLISLVHVSIIIVAVFLLTVEITVTHTESADFIFGECQADKDGCRDCYLALVKSLLGNDGNVYNLSRAFFPPIVDPPDSVIVKYRFVNDTMDEIDTWFWATSGVYFLHPMLIFQFISLLFGKYRPIYEQITTVTFNASECFGVSDDYMTLLTQRLKVYIQEHTIFPEMGDSYAAMAVNNRTFQQMLMARYIGVEATHINFIIICPIIIVIVMVIIVLVVVPIHYFFRDTFKEGGLNRHRKAAIVSIAIISFNRLVYFAALDICAVSFRSEITVKYPEYSFIHYDGPPGTLHGILYHIPSFLLLFDLLFLIPSFFCIVASLIGLCKWKVSPTPQSTQPQLELQTLSQPDTMAPSTPPSSAQEAHDRLDTLQNTPLLNDQEIQLEPLQTDSSCEPTNTSSERETSLDNGEKKILEDKVYYCLVPIIIFFLLGVLLHMPYIAMAYLSDPRHAASILLYYIVVTFVEFGLLELTFRSIWFGKIDHGSAQNLPNEGRCILGTIIAVLLSLSVYALTVTATMFFYLIPVSESIGRAPSQIVITYQTAFILVGGYIIYKVIIKKQNSLQRAIRACHTEWKSKPDHELLTFFFKDIIKMVENFLKSHTQPKQKIQTIDERKDKAPTGKMNPSTK